MPHQTVARLGSNNIPKGLQQHCRSILLNGRNQHPDRLDDSLHATSTDIEIESAPPKEVLVPQLTSNQTSPTNSSQKTP
jgi:hypothetical protein